MRTRLIIHLSDKITDACFRFDYILCGGCVAFNFPAIPPLPIMMSRDRFEGETRLIRQMPRAFMNQQAGCADFTITPKHYDGSASNSFLLSKHSRYRETASPKNRYQNSLKTLHIRVFPRFHSMRLRCRHYQRPQTRWK